MDSARKDFIAQMTAAIVAVSALLSGAADFFKQQEGLLASLDIHAPRGTLPAINILLLIVAGIVFWRHRKRSRFKDVDKVHLRRSNRETLVGRDDDIQRLKEKCSGFPLVTLKGDSGCGKSALLQAGLVPELQDSKALLPLMFDYDGADWDRAPAAGLARALAIALSTETTPVRADDIGELGEAIRRVKKQTSRQPLLIFDQLDDYQQNHRDKFITPELSTLTREQLLDQNDFWSDIAAAMKCGDAHLLFATRQDMAGWLESFRFTEPKDHNLPSVEQSPIKTLLLKFGDPEFGAIENPEDGWVQLVDQLVDDTSVQGRILPQRLRAALRGLERLPALTPYEYQSAGRNVGLERLYVDGAITRAANASQLPERAVRELLDDLVDPLDRRKTRRRTVDDLVLRLARAGLAATDQSVRKALDELVDSDVVRYVFDASEPGKSVIVLDHDYLAPAVTLSNRQADRWNVLLAERLTAFGKAGWNLLKRWQALLKPREFWKVLWAKAARHPDAPVFTGRMRFLGVSSLSTLVPIAVIAFVGFFGANLYRDFLFQKQMSSMVAALFADEDGEPTPSFWNEARRIPGLPLRHRERLLREALTNEYASNNLLPVLRYFIRALAGTSERARQGLVKVALSIDPGQLHGSQLLAREIALKHLGESSAESSERLLTALAEREKKSGRVDLPSYFGLLFLDALEHSKPEDQAKLVSEICASKERTKEGLLGILYNSHSLSASAEKARASPECRQRFSFRFSNGDFSFLKSALASAKTDDQKRDLLVDGSVDSEIGIRRQWYDAVVATLGPETLKRLLEGGTEHWAWQTPLAEFDPKIAERTSIETRQGFVRDGDGTSSYFLRGSDGGYRAFIAYFSLPTKARQGLVQRLAESSIGCNFVEGVSPRFSDQELTDYMGAVLKLLRERSSGGSPCIADDDMPRLAPRLRQIAPNPAGGAWADLAQLVLKIGDAQKQFRDPMAAQITSESMGHMRSLFGAYAAADASKPLSREDEFLLGNVEEALFLLREDVLRKSLSAADADFLWSGIRSLVKRAPRRGEYVSAVEALRVQLGKPVDPDLQQVFSDSVVAEPLHFSYREDDDGTIVPKLVRDLPPLLRKKMVESIKQKLCVVDSPSDVRSLALLLSAALRDDWNHAPWPAFRLSWMATPMALGADDALLDDSPPALPEGAIDTEIEWALWSRFSAFRTQHGLPAAEEENVMSQCVAQAI